MQNVSASPQRILVIGGGGFIGAHLVAHCARRGDAVHVVVRPGSSLDRLRPWLSSIRVHEAPLGDRAAMDVVLAAARPGQVFHLAVADRRSAQPDLGDARLSITDDLANLVNLLAACAAASAPPGAFVRAGSLAEYGTAPAPYDETQRESPLDSYAAGLVAGTHYARMLCGRLPFPICTARLALTYGAAQSERFLLPGLIRRCLAGANSFIARPRDRRDLMHVDDAVAGLLRVADQPVVPVVNLATGFAPSMAEVSARVCAATGADPRLVTFGPSRSAGGVPDLRGSGRLARQQLDWVPQIGLDEGLARTVAWHRAELQLREAG